MRRRKRLLAPYLADSYVVESISLLIGLIAFLIGYYLENQGSVSPSTPRGTTSLALPLVIGLLGTLVADGLIERAVARTRAGRLQRLEAALTDQNVFDYIATITESYKQASANMRTSYHPLLYKEVSETLLAGKDWQNLAQRRLEIRDSVRELTIARELLPTAKRRVRAISLPEELGYLESEGGLDYLEKQAECIKSGLQIMRLFVYSNQTAQKLNLNLSDLKECILRVSTLHARKGVTCRILNLDSIVPVRDVPDINIYDSHTVRYSTLILRQGHMQAVVSEHEADVKEFAQLFDFLWMNAKDA